MGNGRHWALVGLVAIGIAVGAAACSSDSGSDGGASGPPGASIYASNCATCHAADGSGGQGPAIGDGKAKAAYTEAEMVDLVTEGKNAMPSWKGTLSAEQIDQVVAYVRDDLGQPAATDSTTTEAKGDAGRGSLSGTPPEMEVEDDWAIANHDYWSTRTVPNPKITSRNVEDLELAWTYEAEGGGTFGNLTTNPLVVGDHVYLGALTTEVHSIDRTSGKGEFVVGEEVGIFGPTGVGIGWGQLYGTKADEDGDGSVLVAYDADTGKEVWATDLGERGGIINMQPSAYDGLVFASTSGYGGGTIATIYAVDAATGDIVWDFPVIADPGLWGNPELNSGGGVWYQPAIDTQRRIAYFGTGNPYPFPGAEGFPNGSSRPGDNKWTDSTVALDIDTGELAWGHQAIPHDIFDRDNMLAARTVIKVDGKAREAVISTGKLGVVYALDPDTGEEIWKTSVGTHQNDELTEIDGPTLVYPGSLGGVQTPIAIVDNTIYACVMNAPTEYAGPEETSYGFTVQLGTADSQLVSIDAGTGEINGTVDLPGDSFGGATVSGDLVFTSSFSGTILALDRRTGETLWTYEAPGGINGWPAIAGDELYVPVGMADPPQLLKFELPS